MTKLKPSVKAAIASTLVLTSTAAIAYAVPKLTNEKATSAEHQLKLDVERVDSDTVKVAIDNIQDIPKAIQFSIKLDGAKLKDGENSIKDLVKKEVEKRLKNDEYLTTSNSILTDYTYNEVKNTIDVLITSENSLPKTENKLEVFELDIKGLSDSIQSYKVVPNNEKEYKYVSNTNKEYNDLVVTHENKDITINTAPIITSEERYINIVEGEKLELTPKILKEKIGLDMQHEDGVENLTLEVKKDNKVITEFTENTPGIYELEITAVKENTIKSEPLKIQVNVALDNVTEPPTITMNEEQLTDITISGGSIFKPLEGVKAVDKKGRNVDVDVKVDKDLDLDPEQNTDYVLTYTATDIYGNKATKQITLTVVANQAPVILGVKDHTISVGDKFDPMNGVTVTDEDKNIELKVDSNVNTNIAGEYKVSYSATDSKGKIARAQSKVTVNPKSGIINRIPTIIASDKTIKVGDKFNPLEGVTANDEEEGDLTHRIKVVANDVDTYTAGTYTVKYQVADSKGATTTKEITVTVKSDIVLAKNIAINNKSDNKVYIGGSKTITASVDENADLKEIDWKISDSSIAELRIVRNEARITAKAKGQVTLTALTTDGSDLSDTITINVSIFEEDSEVPSYVKDVVDTDVLTPVSGLGIEESPIEFEVKDVTVDKLDKFLDNLESLDYELLSINQDDDFTIYKIKVSNKGRMLRLFKSTEDTYISIKVSKSLDNANEINDRLEKLADKGTEKPVNSKPIIFIEGLNTNITVGDTFNPLDGVTAFDEEDGDLTDSIKVSGKVDTTKSGKYTLKYTVKDSQGEENSITIDIIVSEKTGKPEVIKGEKPVIKVTSSIDTITVGDKFDPLSGISAYDKEDGDLTAHIKVSGSVNTSKVGEYKLTYTVEDKDGNVSTFTRIIFVKEKVISTNESNNPKTGDSSILGYVSIFTIAAGGLFIKRKNLK